VLTSGVSNHDCSGSCTPTPILPYALTLTVMFRYVHNWLPGYLKSVARRPRGVAGSLHLVFCVANHFEPFRGGVTKREALERVGRWCRDYPSVAGDLRDSDGRCPKQTFFYPQDEYDAECMEQVGALCRNGFGEVEVHLHHRNDTAEGFRKKLAEFRDVLRRQHGLLGEWKIEPKRERGRGEGRIADQGIGSYREEEGPHVERSAPAGENEPRRSGDRLLQREGLGDRSKSSNHRLDELPAFGFIHGNWALCNSRPDGDWCGVNEELGILREAGCYADFTFPSAPSPTQPRMVNAIYRATDTGLPRACDRGEYVRVCPASRIQHPESSIQKPAFLGPDSAIRLRQGFAGQVGIRHSAFDRSLVLITGPLALDWGNRKWGILPRIENGSLTAVNPPVPRRVDLWVRQHIHVGGRPEWVFVKVYTHGCYGPDTDTLLGGAFRAMCGHLQSAYNDGKNWILHYVTAREMYNMVRAAETGMAGNPGEYRDYEVAPPACAR